MRRTIAHVPSTIALIVVALLASSAAAVSFTGGPRSTRTAARATAQAPIGDAPERASEPDGLARTPILHVLAPSIVRVHVPQANGDGARNAAALNVAQASLDLAARHAPGTAVSARQHGVASPGQPAPSSRAPPIG
jgi:hypothetical protein